MRLWRLAACVLLIAALASAQDDADYDNTANEQARLTTQLVTHTSAPNYTIRKEVELVELSFTVRDERGNLVRGVKPEDVRVLENEREVRTIKHFAQSDDLPLRVGLVVDASESMAKWKNAPKLALRRFAELQMRQQTDRAFVVLFGENVSLRQEATNNGAVLIAASERIQRRRHTALFDAIVDACERDLVHPEAGVSSRRALVVVSDGEDNMSRYSLEDAILAAQREGVAIHVLGLVDPKWHTRGERHLARLARETGGLAIFPEKASQVEVALARIEEELRTQYTIAFTPERGGVTTRQLAVEPRQSGWTAHLRGAYHPKRVSLTLFKKRP